MQAVDSTRHVQARSCRASGTPRARATKSTCRRPTTAYLDQESMGTDRTLHGRYRTEPTRCCASSSVDSASRRSAHPSFRSTSRRSGGGAADHRTRGTARRGRAQLSIIGGLVPRAARVVVRSPISTSHSLYETPIAQRGAPRSRAKDGRLVLARIIPAAGLISTRHADQASQEEIRPPVPGRPPRQGGMEGINLTTRV